jgi:hypothetical protein
MPDDSIHLWLSGFPLDSFLREHIAGVLATLPDVVLDDMVGDPGFTFCDYEPIAGTTFHVPVGLPTRYRASRSVVLKRTLRRRPESFVRYVIAHELAHAHLRNAGRFPGEDPEHAADALAAAWGFPRPARV